VPYIAEAYRKLFPQDTVVEGDAHQYLLDHHREFDFIWSSPPCPSHSRTNTFLNAKGHVRYPDMKLYQEIIFLRKWFYGKWVVENVEPYYAPLIQPTTFLDRHMFWANFHIPFTPRQRKGNLEDATIGSLTISHDIQLPMGTKDGRKLLRNAVDPKIGLHILKAAQKEVMQESLI
jgi:DNA (cytosine-5)-methyltransferase 1